MQLVGLVIKVISGKEHKEIKLLIKLFTPAFSYFLPLRPKYFLNALFLNTFSVYSLGQLS
jgi:hypothetical protein